MARRIKGSEREEMRAPSVEAADSASESRPRRSAVESSLSSSTLRSDTPAFSAALSRPAFSTKLSSFFSSSLAARRA
jgi:VIT1/CCC1 family predicted Fe2+/Mn2+ transporter